MKKLFIAVLLMLASCTPVLAQKVGGDTKNNIVHVVKKTNKGTLTNSGHSLQDSDDNKVYVVYITAKNKLVIKRVKKSGKNAGEAYNYRIKGVKKYESQYNAIVADLKKQGITVE